jgi:hypothetical protein
LISTRSSCFRSRAVIFESVSGLIFILITVRSLKILETELKRSEDFDQNALIFTETFKGKLGESLLLRKLILGIQAQVRGKSLTGLIIICEFFHLPASAAFLSRACSAVRRI